MAKKKPALGSGLEALFGDIGAKVPASKAVAPENKPRKPKEKAHSVSENAILYVDIDDIKPNSMQPRQKIDPEAIDGLADSIEKYGILEPVILTKADVGYELVAGERRWRAARKAGLKEVPAIIRELSGEEIALIAIIENVQRENLNTIEEATAYRTIIDKYGMTQESLAKVVGRSRPHIANILRTLGLPPEIVDLLRVGKLSLGHANALGAIKDAEVQVELAKRIAEKDISVRETESLAAAATDGKTARKRRKNKKSAEIRMVEQELTSATGVRVVITGDGRKGNVELKYFDRQDLDEIIEFLRKASRKR